MSTSTQQMIYNNLVTLGLNMSKPINNITAELPGHYDLKLFHAL